MKPLDIKDLTIEQKIGQMLLARPPVNKYDRDYILDMLKNKCLGGIHVTGFFSEYYAGFNHKEEALLFSETAGYPVLICEDMEFGFFQGELQLPSPMAIGSTDSEQLAYEFGRITALEAKAAGYNTVFGPIMDIAMNPRSSCVGPRAFGGAKEIVARMATAAIKGYQEQGMVVAAKHYPGFGESHVDSHIGMVYLKGDESSLIDRELYPYLKAMREADLSGIMVGHIMVPKVDEKYPATISSKLIGIIRKCGYNGLIMTDSFAMIGMTNMFGIEECHRMAMAAGNDMVMTSYRIGAKAAYEYLLKAYHDGVVTEEQIDAAATRVLAAQRRTLKKSLQPGITQKERDLVARMAQDAIAVTLDGVDSAAVDPRQRHLVIILEGNTFVHQKSAELYQEDNGLKVAEQRIREKFINSDILKMSEFPSRPEIELVLKTTMDYDSIIMVAFNRSKSYVGSSDLTERVLAVIEGLTHKLSAVVLFGNPYAAREFVKVPRIIYGFDNGLCQEYAIRVLAGESMAKGKLPVNF